MLGIGEGILGIGAFKQRLPRPEEALPGRDQPLPLHSGYTFRTRAILDGLRSLGIETFHLTGCKQGPASAALDTQLPPTGVVTARVAEFSIPVAHNGPWRWDQTTTPDDYKEYGWEISVKSGSEEYEFGFSLFKLPGAKERVGDLARLLKAGQASLWKKEPSGGASVVPGARVSVSAGARRVIIRIVDPAIVRLLFGHRPATVRVLTDAPDIGSASHEISVSYVSSSGRDRPASDIPRGVVEPLRDRVGDPSRRGRLRGQRTCAARS